MRGFNNIGSSFQFDMNRELQSIENEIKNDLSSIMQQQNNQMSIFRNQPMQTSNFGFTSSIFNDNSPSSSTKRRRQHHHHHPHQHQESAYERERRLERQEAELQAQAALKIKQEEQIEREAILQKQRKEERIKEKAHQQELAIIREKQLKEEREAAKEQQRLQQIILEQKRVEHEKEEKIREKEREAIEAKRQEALKLERAEKEGLRVAAYKAHESFISDAETLTYPELCPKLEALSVLKEPHKEFADTAYKGLPYRGTVSAFYALLKNPNLTPKEKFNVITSLESKGYADYFSVLFSAPSLGLLMTETYRESVLLPFYKNFVARNIIAEDNEKQIWQAFASDTTICLKIFEQLYFTMSGEKAFAFFDVWRDTVIGNKINGFTLDTLYQTLLSHCKNILNSKSHNTLQQSFLERSQNNYAALFCIYLNAEIGYKTLQQIFFDWSVRGNPLDIENFMAHYKIFYGKFLHYPEIHLVFPIDIARSVFNLREESANDFYVWLGTISAPQENRFEFLVTWANAFDQPHPLPLLQKHYLEFITTHKPFVIMKDEEQLWFKLVSSNRANGKEIFDTLFKDAFTIKKLLKFAETWFSALNNTQHIIDGYHVIKEAIRSRSIADFRFDFRKMAEIRIQEIAAAHKPIHDEAAVVKWLKYSRPMFFKRPCASELDSYDAYVQITQKHANAKTLIFSEQIQSEENIDAHLRKASGQESGYRYTR